MSFQDHPAAHSMDTTWFAVDRDGKVASFDTGEAGAMPATSGDPEEVVAHLDALPRRAARLRVRTLPAFAGESPHRASPGHPALLHLKRAEVLAPELAAGDALRVPSEGSEAVYVASPSAGLLARVHASGECLGCAHEYGAPGGGAEGELPPPARRGLYEYAHGCDNWIAGPYQLVAKPDVPLKEGDLPAAVRDRLARYGGSFDETPLLQPLAHWECESWEAAWLDTDGRTVRPVPGREEDYADAVADSRDMDGLVFVDPPGQPAKARPEAAEREAAPPAPPPARKPWWRFW